MRSGYTKLLQRSHGQVRRPAPIEGILRVLGPDATLRRGYSITMNEHGKIIRTIAAIQSKMKIRTRVSDAEFGSEIL
jgi:exonuclease VII large subunit